MRISHGNLMIDFSEPNDPYANMSLSHASLTTLILTPCQSGLPGFALDHRLGTSKEDKWHTGDGKWGEGRHCLIVM